MTISWSIAGLPPAYLERTWRVAVPDHLRAQVDDFIARTKFFDLPESAGGNDPDGRDMGTYSITVVDRSRAHTVRFSDSTQSADLAAFRAWLDQNLASLA
ncbi:MAG TPA: protealysin inhibitor emfourin [Vicinamibacterales bacterium]|nr:protealysin inhibitor emfourin [Vicinamibacterales bacterium]